MPWAKTLASGAPAASSSRTVVSWPTFSIDSSMTRSAMSFGTTQAPSISPKNPVAGTNRHAAALDRHVDADDAAAALAVEWPDRPGEHSFYGHHVADSYRNPAPGAVGIVPANIRKCTHGRSGNQS